MALKLIVDSLDSVPENLRDNYKESGGKFRLDLEGYEDPAGLKSALQKEREAAKASSREVSAWKAMGKTPEEIQALIESQRELEEKALLAEKKFDEVLSKRTERMQAENAKALNERDERIAKSEAKSAKLAAGKLADTIGKAALKAGALPEALDDIVARAIASGWRLNDDGDSVAMTGDDVILGKDGKTPLTPIEWAESQRDPAPHLYQKAQGTNAPGSGSGPRGGSNKGKIDGTPEERTAYFAGKFPGLAPTK